MPNQKGSLKDRLRSWNIFLKYKFNILKKKKEEKKRNKIMNKNIQISASGKYYSKPKIFGLTLTGLFLGIFENRADKEKYVEQVETKLDNLDKKIDSIDFLEYSQNISDIEKSIITIKARYKFNKDVINRVEYCETKLNDIKNNKMNISSKSNNLEKATLNSRKSGIYTPVLEIKVINKELKTCDKKIKEISEKIKNTTDYNSLYDLEFALKQLKIKINDLLNKYRNIKELQGFSNLENILDIEDIDFLRLRFDSSMINTTIKKCDECLDDIAQKRKSLLENKEKEVQTQKEEVKKKQKAKNKSEEKKKEKKVEDKLSEVKFANKIVLERLAVEKRNIEKFQKSIYKMTTRKRKRSIFFYTSNILSSIINFGLSLFPLSLFKNKLIGGLAGGIMINNSLKSVRKILNPEVETIYILYNDFENELNQTHDYLNSISYICNDSLNQIEEIRNSIYHQYGNDLEYSDLLLKYLKDLDDIQSQILHEQKSILKMQDKISATRIKNKQKTKEWNN